MGKLVLMHKEDMVKKYGARLNFDTDNFDYDGEDWEVFLDELRGLRMLIVAELATWYRR